MTKTLARPINVAVAGNPNSGKTTLFNALTKATIAAENYPFCTIDPNIGVVPLPDHRLDVLAEIVKPENIQSAIARAKERLGLVYHPSGGGPAQQPVVHRAPLNSLDSRLATSRPGFMLCVTAKNAGDSRCFDPCC